MRPFALTLALLAGSGAASAQHEAAAKEVRDLVVAFNDAYERNDLDEYFSYYARDLTQWFESGRTSLEDYKTSWYRLIESGGGVEENELSDVQIQVGPSGDTAVATYRVDVVTRAADGSKTKERAWETDVWFKRGGEWKIIHLHYNSAEVP